ncbi:MAG: hypothetical protein H8D45_27715 [Bacteroidetes bacterium]|nr:hypothetical protein [Bacteroidota bacterium]
MVCCGSGGPGSPSPFVQTKFLGSSIVDFSASADFGGTGGGLSVNLVQDECQGNSKVYVDSNGSLQTTTDADSFLPSGVGSPVYFYYGGLYYGGLLSDWQESNSADGPKIYSVNVTSPRQIVENTQVILQSYCGSVFGVPNLLNVHGYLNSLCGTCLETGFLTTYPMFGMGAPLTYTPTGSWCKTSETGWTWTSVSNALLMMLGGAGGAYGGVLEYRGYTYTLDISDLPALNDQIRINNESMSLADLIDYICGLAGVDYFYELTPAAAGGAVCGTSGQLGGGIHSIKVVVGNSPYQSFEQSAQDVNDAVCTAIDTRLDYGVIASNIGAANCVNRYSRGLQTRNEYSTAFITGEYRQDVWQMQYNGSCDGEDTIWPYWGKDNEGNVILGEGCDFGDFDVETTHKFTLDISHLDVGPATWEVTMPELRAALVGETNWRAWCLEKEVTKFSGLGTTAEYKIPAEGFIANALSDAILNNADPDIAGMKAPDLLNMGNVEMGEKTTTESWRKGSVLYDFIRKYAQEYYGKKFMVKLPFMCKAVDTDEPYSFANSWLPSDGGWTEWPVLGYATNSPQVMFFRGDDGRVGCFARYLSTEPLIIDNLSKEDVYPISMYECLVRGTVEDIVWVTPNDARAVIQISGPVRQRHSSDVLPEWLLMLALKDDVDPVKFKNIEWGPSNDKLNLGMEYQLLLPTSVAVPLQSQKLVYGPWLYSNIDDFDYYGLGSVFDGDDYGMTHYERDPELAPWNYGSFYLMNYAGHSIATSRVGDKFVSEKGEITFPGGPAGSLGSAIAAGGPIISNIDVQVGRGNGEVLTTYRMKTYVPDWGQMGKARVDMIRRASKMGMKVYNLFRHKIVKRHHDISIRQVEQDLLEWRKTHQFDASSSHEYFDGAA